jgi:hypothetical protein
MKTAEATNANGVLVEEPETHGVLTTDLLEVASLGSGLHLVSERKAEFTHQLCEKILDLKEFVGERPLRDAHVTKLTKHMQQGTFHNEMVRLTSPRGIQED